VKIPVGKRTAFVGPSGSGKSTVLQILMRLIEPDEGALLVDGVDVRERSLSSLRNQIGVVFQDPFLFNLSLAENIALGGDHPTPEQVQAAATAAEIDSFIDQLSDGIHSNVGESGSMLSGGQRQRAAIARALVANPALLILDEATSALDAATERQINDTLDRAVDGRTVVTVTHRLTSITDYDHIVVLVDGVVESQGTHAQLLSEGGMYARLWSEQTGTPMPVAPAFDPIASLADLPIFRSVDPTRLHQLVATGQPVRFGTGATTTSSAGGLAIMLDGRAELTNPDGETVLASRGDVVGGAALLRGTEATTIRATEPIEILMLSAELIAPFLEGQASSFSNTLVLPASSKTLVRATISGDGAAVAGPQPGHAVDVRATMRMSIPRSDK
jgi:ABC-type multidrug transport system ATPase subunit